VHVVCNNAGPGTGGPLELTTPGDCDWIIGVDLMGTIYGCQTFLPHIKAHGEGGHIVSTASVTGMIPVPGVAFTTPPKLASSHFRKPSLRNSRAPQSA